MALHDFCGLDFGTSNSTIGIYKDNQITMVPLDSGKQILRSAIFFDYDTSQCILGQRGLTEYLTGTPGRLLMSLKSVLGSPLMQEKTLIENRMVAYTDILGYLIRHLKQQAENTLGRELQQVVMGRPVRFHDTDNKKDKLAQDTLEQIAKNQGFKDIIFQYEPIAAALSYEATIAEEQLAFIVDLGGGTSDFSVIRLRPQPENASTHRVRSQDSHRREDVLANKGIHIGGTDFDRLFSLNTVMPELGLGGKMRGLSGNIQIPSSFYHDLTTWHTINSLYTYQSKNAIHNLKGYALLKNPIERLIKVVDRQLGHKILNEVELGKCQLSSKETVLLDLSFIEKEWLLKTTRAAFEAIISEKVEKLLETCQETLKESGVSNHHIDSIFFTGGSTQIPIIRDSIAKLFPNSKIIQGDVFESVGKGLIIDAARRFMH